MWALKVLSGPQAGKLIQLHEGAQTLGRSTQAHIKIKSHLISKIHAKIVVTEDKVILSDNQSSNGVVVNGIKIQNMALKPGDKFALGDIIFDLVKLPSFVSILPDVGMVPSSSSSPTMARGNTALSPVGQQDLAVGNDNIVMMNLEDESSKQRKNDQGLQERIESYIEEVALPGVYQYSSKYDLKYVVLGFVTFFVMMVTALTTWPVIQISRDFVVDESLRRADALTKILVQENRDYIITKNEISVNVGAVRNEPGVDKTFIVDALDGRIIAPTNERGRYSNIPFIQRARKKSTPYKEIMDSQIGVSRPILFNNPMTGEPAPAAYAIVLYNLDRVALDVPRTLSLMIQILLIALLSGVVLYFFLYKVITKPLYDLNDELNTALRDGSQNIEVATSTPIYQKLISNINSALSRMSREQNNQVQVSHGDKNMEASEMVMMFPIAALALAPNEMIIANNSLISGHPLFDDADLKDKALEDLSDPSLVQNLRDLLQRAVDNPNQKHTSHLPASNGIQFEVAIKSIQEMGNVAYYLVCFTEVYEEGDS